MQIKTTDPQALEKLNAKLQKLENEQKLMKEINTIIRSSKSEEAKIEFIMTKCKTCRENAISLLHPKETWQKPGFASFYLTNNSAEIHRIKQRIATITIYQQEVASVQTSGELPEYPFPGGRIVENIPENRLQIFFEEKPVKEIREKLKHQGFRWTPSNGSWQCYRHFHILEWAQNEFQAGRIK